METRQAMPFPSPTNSGAATCDFFAAGPLPPCTLVIFGASGDLTGRKLVPALYDLFRNNSLPQPGAVVGCGRTGFGHHSFRDELRRASHLGADELQRWPEFAANLFYQPLVYDEPASYQSLARFLLQLDKERGIGGNMVFYLATPPELYPVVATMLGRSGLSRQENGEKGWRRIVVEKPFGHDLDSAVLLDRTLHQSFEESQIFRIDHYLAKETVQNILMFRFANALFEPLWSRSYIDYVGIVAAESLGVEHRAGFYENAGVLRDMFQNHLHQLLALTAMEPPPQFEAQMVQDEKSKCFRSLKPLAPGTLHENLILGQYQAGSRDGESLPGYRQEPGVDKDSVTPTFAMMRVFIDNWRWRGVPFYLVSGKRLADKITRIVVQFKQVPHSLFKHVVGGPLVGNRLVLGIHPQEKISLTFLAKSPGAAACLQPVTMEFQYRQQFRGPSLDAYAKVLLDCIRGDHMLFWRQDGVELSWAFLSPILRRCESCTEPALPLHPYEAGSWGPEAAHDWLRLVLDDEMTGTQL